MDTIIYFIRHAHSVYSTDERQRPLSEKGKNDSRRIAAALQDIDMDMIFSSPYKRAVQTVEPLAGLLGKEIITIENLKERLLSDQPVEDFMKSVEKVWADVHFALPGGESNKMAQERAVKELLKLLYKHQGQKIAIGTHGNIMVLMMNYFDSNYGFGFWQELSMPDIWELVFRDKELRSAKLVAL
jgi:2,3-bisphosphoglycerate-dependent phosphoglycerate mutase